MTDTDVVVIGAGLAGLACAGQLVEAGREVVVLEAADAVGGRVRTDPVDGFLVDRGFQLLNPAYPAVGRLVDVAALGLQTFDAGVAVRRPTGLSVVADPRRAPRRLRSTLTGGLLKPRELAALARWAGPVVARPGRVKSAPDLTLAESLDRAGVAGPLRQEVLEPFLAGVLADDTGTTSATFVKLLVRTFLLGTPGLPRGGMQALPEQLAAPLGDRVRLGVRATGVEGRRDGVRVTTDTATISARAAVVAVAAEDVAGFSGGATPRTSGLVTWWFATDSPPYDQALLTVDGRARGPVQHAAVVSHAAPSYAPTGRHLVEATCLPSREGATDETAVRRHLGDLWRTSAHDWDLLVRHDIAHALPFQAVGVGSFRTTSAARIGERTYAAGDHRDTASIQGALVSGERIARAVLRDLGESAH
ncbi:NAD(P)/FAD-dependent oxidoreductase [Nocardioides bigeumensis]|uniref:NAD(P)/FAD-dependent oxidoreductase n=1 Tax=Nocardioides bigeumensis TaxID=433657 RepID=A0ABN2YS85_9ACTN